MAVNREIVRLALEAGFDAAGIARLEENSTGFKQFQKWISSGFHGEMVYLEKGLEKRRDPSFVLPQAKSIILLTLHDQANSNLQKSSPFISRYAWGEDYHLLLDRKMQVLEDLLCAKFPNSRFKRYIDTGPIQEKYWASLAGLGWIGKHTNLIHPERGSYFFLASLLTDLELEPNSPLGDHCGKCTACIDICPTKAITAPYVLDARLCISYLTIELKGPIPKNLRSLIGTHVFGCDDCQEVCPWNRHSKLPIESLRKTNILELIEYLSYSEEDFRKRFSKTPILRPKRRGFLRNVCVVLGNLKDSLSIPPLISVLSDEEPLIRGHAAWALGRFKEKRVLNSLKMRLRVEKEKWVREELQEAIDNSLYSEV